MALFATAVTVSSFSALLGSGYLLFGIQRTEFEVYTKRLLTYPVSRTTIVFTQLSEEDKAAIIHHMRFMLGATADVITHRHKGYIYRGHRIRGHTEKITIPAYYKWDGDKLTIISGRPYSKLQAKVVQLLLEKAMLTKQTLPSMSKININGSYSGEVYVNLLKAELSYYSDNPTEDDHASYTCILKLPMVSLPKLTANNGKDRFALMLRKGEKVNATFSADSGLDQHKVFDVSQLSFASISLVAYQYKPPARSYPIATMLDKATVCSLLAPPELDEKLQISLAKHTLGSFLSNLSVKKIKVEQSVSFSPWYEEGYIPVVGSLT